MLGIVVLLTLLIKEKNMSKKKTETKTEKTESKKTSKKAPKAKAKKPMTTKKKVIIGAVTTVLTAVAAGVYFKLSGGTPSA
jgi:uncharacterized membrane protein